MTTTRTTKLAAMAAAAGCVGAYLVGSPHALGAPDPNSGTLFDLINQQHVAAGCAPYGRAPALGDVALQYAKTLATNNGQLQSNTVPLLQGKGYNPSYWGEMDYFNPNGATPQDTVDFWLNNPTKDLFGNCDITQMEVAVWIDNGKWGASSIMGTPKGSTPPATNPGNGNPPNQPPVGSGGPDGALLAAVNDARLHPEKYPPHGNTAGAAMSACPNAFNDSGALDSAAATHNSYIASQPKDSDPHQNANGKRSWEDGGPIEAAGYNSARGEIVATGQSTANAAVVAWMQDDANASPPWGHRNNILNCGYADAGAAHLTGGPWGNYWTVDMGTH
jgi:hypothetical protein